MSRFAQHTSLIAAPGKREELIAKFLQAAAIQQENPACEVMLVSSTPDQADAVTLTEVWTSEEAWRRARDSEEIQVWAASMPGLVAAAPDSTRLEVRGGKGVSVAG